MREQIEQGLAELEIEAPAQAAEQLAEYGRLLIAGNQAMNLTAITQPRDVAALHMLDCAALLKFADFQGKKLIDVGTGAGFPGMVLKILVPSLEVTLLDSLGKRLDWLERVISVLGLSGVRTVHARGEEQAHQAEFRERFDFAAARAVAALPVLGELCLPFVRVGGQFLAMKSVESEQELELARGGLARLGGGNVACRDYRIPGSDIQHRVVLVEKSEATAGKFPRRWAKIQKAPL